MRKLLLLLLMVAVVVIAVYRQRLFLRDPLGKVLVNGMHVQGASVFINYTNDVLIQFADGRLAVIVQHWDRTPGHPQQFVCLRTLACLTPNDHAPKLALGEKDFPPETTMSDREVKYRTVVDEAVRVVIR